MKKKWLLVGLVLLLSLVIHVAYAASELTILIHGKKVTSDIPAKIENGTILVPLRVIAENLNQKVRWDPKTNTVTIEEKKKQSEIKRMVVQRDKDIFIADSLEGSDNHSAANQALIYNLYTLYNEVYRGFLSTDLGTDMKLKTESDLPFIKNSEATKEGAAKESYTFIRMVRSPYITQPGQNAPSSKDLVFYLDPKNQNDLYIAVQNPEQVKEWTTYTVKGYGLWLQKEIHIYLRGSRGL